MSDGKVRALVERAIQASGALDAAINPDTPRIVLMRSHHKPHLEELEAVRAAADALDARPLWPSGPQAAEQLRLVLDELWRDSVLPDRRRQIAAVVLARLNNEEIAG